MLKFQSKRTFLGFQLLFIFINLFGNNLVAQNEPSIFNESRKLMGLSIYAGCGVYRDFSTSPLFYELPGLGITFSGIYYTENGVKYCFKHYWHEDFKINTIFDIWQSDADLENDLVK